MLPEEIILATVQSADSETLLVADDVSHMEILVHSPAAANYAAGDHLKIGYNGAMTRSLPPQIYATMLQRI